MRIVINITGVLFALMLGALSGKAQITGAKYKIEYNSTTCRYDIFLTEIVGTAPDSTYRYTRTGQLTIIVPTGSVLGMQYPNEPRDRSGLMNPHAWVSGDVVIDPPALAGYDIYAFTPYATNTIYTTAINGGTDLLLFSIDISGSTCGSGVRLWENGVDPPGSEPGMGGGDFSNSFKIGRSTAERYNGNVAGNTTPPSPGITSLLPNCTATDLNIDLTAVGSACSGGLTYSWIGPGYVGTSEDVNIMGATPDNAGTYEVTVTDQNGCTVTGSVAMTEVNCLVLPVTLSAFEVKEEGCKNVLYWTTSTEQNNEYFSIERSEDGKIYKEIGRVKGSGNSNERKKYSYTDAKAPEGLSYYRLRQKDYNGVSSYSSTRVSVIRCGEASERPVLITPNPSNGLFTVYTPESVDSYTVTDASGKAVAARRGIAPGSDILDLQSLPQGLYLLTYKTDTRIITEKLVIIR